MGFFSKLKGLFSGRGATAPSGSGERKGFFEQLKERRKEHKIAREWKRSQKRMEKMEKESQKQKEQRKEEEQEQKKEDQRRKEEAHEKARKSFKENWGFSDKEYDAFIQFISGIGDELKEIFGSDNLVEIFRTGISYQLSAPELKHILYQSYIHSEGGTQEDLIDFVYLNIQGYAQRKGTDI